MTTTKISAGEYRTSEGFRVSRAWQDEGRRSTLWNLFDANDHYCQTFYTKREAVEAAARIATGEQTADSARY